jgi:protein transport protein SEC24
MEQQQDPNKLPYSNLTGGQAYSAPGAIRPPMPNNMRPPPPRPQMTQPSQRPPGPFASGVPRPQQSGQVRPPMPLPARPPMSTNAVRPPMPPRPMVPSSQVNQTPRPSVPQSPSQGTFSSMQPVSQRPSMPQFTPNGTSIPVQRPPTNPQGGPPVPMRPPVLSSGQNRPPILDQSAPLVSSGGLVPRPPVAAATQSWQAPVGPPTSELSQSVQLPTKPSIPGISQPVQFPTRPPIPSMSLPVQSPSRPPIPGVPQPTQNPARPPIPGLTPPIQNQMKPPMNMAPPVMSAFNHQQAPAMRPPIPQIPLNPPMSSPASQAPSTFSAPAQQQPALRPPFPIPVASQHPPFSITPSRPPIPGHTSGGYPQQHLPIGLRVPESGGPQISSTSASSMPQMHLAPQAPGMGQAPAHNMPSTFAPSSISQMPQQAAPYNPSTTGYQPSQSGYGSQHGFPHNQIPGAPQTISSTSHSLKEFYDPYEPLITPNIHSDYLSCSLGKVPRNASLLGKARTPFGLTVSFYPYGDIEKDKVPEVTGLIVRCRRCRTYLNPFVELIEQGSRWRCNICYLANEFPPNYDFDLATQKNVDRHDHIELKNFVYDFTNAPIEYTVRPPQPPVFLFALEVTASAVQSGLFAASCRVIQEQLDSIPNDDGRARVAFITFDQRIQFYKMTPNEPNARVFVVADAGDPFLPVCSDLLVNLSECRSQLDALLDQLPQMYSAPSRASSAALGPVLQSAHMLLKSIGGKIVVICSSLPTQFEGALKARDDPKLMGTPKESTLLQPANQFYKLFASEIVKDQVCVDLFVAPPQLTAHVPIYVDLATLSGLTKYTGGKLHYYPEFGTSDGISSKFCSDLRRFLGQTHGFEAVLRIRASQGISLSAYHGSFFLRQTDLLSLPNVNPDHSFSAQASIDENLQGTVVCFQAALLHTTSRGERRIRVINFSAPVTDDVKEVFSNMNVNGIAGILAKMAVEKVLANRLEDAREAVLNKCSDVIAAFKSQYSLKTNPNLLLPEKLKNLPIMLHGLVKSSVLRSGSITHPDFRAYFLTLLKTLSVKEIIGLLLPRFYAIHSMNSEVLN